MTDWDFYCNVYHGDAIPLENWVYYELRAAEQLERYRRIYTVTVPADMPDSEQCAVCAMAEALYGFDLLLQRSIRFPHDDFDRNAALPALVYHEFCPSGVPIPKSQDHIGVLDDLKVPAQRGGPAILLILRKKFCEPDAVRLRVFPGGRIDSFGSTADDLCHILWQVQAQLFYL